ncbi:MAG: bifunctional phosphoglucose/phosphomannose isomerase [Bacteroidota bacterium]
MESTTTFDLAAALDRLDPDDMLGAVCAFPDHFREGWTRAASVEGLSWSATDFDAVVVCGMGGSAIGGDLTRTYCEATSPVPMSVVRGYELPAFVGPKTLVVASSYSGGTEETLSAFRQALDRGATVLCVTTGGTLLDEAKAHNLAHVVVPGGLQPRAALGYSFSVLLRLARALGMTDLPDAALDAALSEASARAERMADTDGNAAFDLAEVLYGKLAVIYSGTGFLEAVNLRWRTQIHENAKAPAVGNLFAELNHNEIMGFEAAPVSISQQMAVVVLRDESDHAQIQKRMTITQGLLGDSVASWNEASADGSTRLGRMFSLLQLGDFVSFWLAMLQGVDPTPVDTIQQLKKTLTEQ